MGAAAWLDSMAGRIERASVLDPIGEALGTLAQKVLGGRRVTDLASGTPLGHPAHPLLVAVPIGSWSAAAVFDLLRDEDAADRLIALGLVTAGPAALTGWNDWRSTSGGERRVGIVHAGLNVGVVLVYTGSLLARRRGRRGLGIVLSMAGASALVASGWLGGHLAYALGVGVDTTAFQHSESEWTDVAAVEDVRVGRLTGADLNGVPLVLTRTIGDDVVALAGRCTHRGGPLSDGELQDNCIVCPWHGSTFALDGSVVTGPATRPQVRYEVRVAEGRVQARRSDEARTLRQNPVGV